MISEMKITVSFDSDEVSFEDVEKNFIESIGYGYTPFGLKMEFNHVKHDNGVVE